jgi:hypothetical protein
MTQPSTCSITSRSSATERRSYWGQGVPKPMRILFHRIDEQGVPQQRFAGFSKSWKKPNMDRTGLEKVVSRWRSVVRQSHDPLSKLADEE